jgi:hypothetical protein
MSLEAKIDALTGVMERFLATVPGAAASAATTSASAEPATAPAAPAPRRGRPPGTGKAKQPTAEDVKAAAFKVRDAISMDAAKKIIKAHGAAELAKLDPSVFTAFIADCEAAVAEAEAGDDAEEESSDL